MAAGKLEPQHLIFYERVTTDHPIAAQALIIRRAVQPLLLHDVADAAAWAQAEKADLAAWQLFLRVERCALPLSRALAARPGLLNSTGEVAAVLAQIARKEFLHVVVARGHLRTVAELALERRVPVIVLKGGALAFRDPVALVDVDILLPAEHISSFGKALPAPEWEKSVQYSARVPETLVAAGVPLEVHHGLGLRGELEVGVWERSEPFADLPPLRQLGPVDHVKHVTHHISLDHSHRRTRLRDLYLLRRAVERCHGEAIGALWSGPDVPYVDRTQRDTLEAVLGRTQDRRLESEALMNYLIALRPRLPFGGRDVHELLNLWAVIMSHTAWERRHIWDAMQVISRVPSSRKYIRIFERLMPPVGLAVRRTIRLSGLILLTVVSWGVAMRTQLRARQLQRLLS